MTPPAPRFPDPSHSISLRDWFAGAALVGLLAACLPARNPVRRTEPPTEEQCLATEAYTIADAMLAERGDGDRTS